jgi:hypothetical protein
MTCSLADDLILGVGFYSCKYVAAINKVESSGTGLDNRHFFGRFLSTGTFLPGDFRLNQRGWRRLQLEVHRGAERMRLRGSPLHDEIHLAALYGTEKPFRFHPSVHPRGSVA